jgi:hypothetical protein
MSDVSIEDQAALAIVFEENIRELVRKHLKQALEDPTFVGAINGYYLSQTMTRTISAGDINFQSAVKSVIINQMNKY